MRRQLNVKVLLGIVVTAALLGGGVYAVHVVQVRRTAGALLTRAEQAGGRGELDEARELLNQFLAYRPDDVGGLTRLGELLATQAETDPQRDRAIRTFERAIVRDPGLLDARRRVVELAMACDPPRHEDAETHLKLLLQSSPEDGELLELLGRCRADAGDFRGAVELFEKARTLAPGRVGAYERLAELLRTRLGDPERADRVMDAREVAEGGLIAENEGSAQAYLARARYRERYDIEGAPDDVARALELAPDDAEVLLAAAADARARGDIDAALRLLRRGAELAPQEAAIYQQSSEVELQAERPEEALTWLEQGIQRMPDEIQLRFSLADALLMLGRWDEAERALDELKEMGLRPELARYFEGRLSLGRERWAEAARRLEDAHLALAAAPDLKILTKQSLLLLGRCYVQMGDSERSYEAYRRAASIDLDPDPLWAAARLGLAASQAARGRIDEAVREYRTVAAREPELPLAVTIARLLTLQNLRLPADRRDWREVERLLDEAGRASPDAIDVPILRAEVLLAQGRPDEARRLIEATREAHPDRAEPWLALATLAGQQGTPEDSLAVLAEARQALGDRPELRIGEVNAWARRVGPQAVEALATLERDAEQLPTGDREPLQRALAAAYLQIGEAARAGQLWARLAEQRPSDLGAQLTRFDLALRSDDEEGAVRALARIRGIEGQEGVLGQFGEALLLTHRARLAPAEHRSPLLGRARDLLREVAVRRPNWAPAVLAQAEVDLLRGDQAGATRNYLRAVDDLGDRSPSTLAAAASLLYRNGRYEQAERMITLLREQDAPISGDLQRLVAEIAFRGRDYGLALEQGQEIVSEQSDDYRDLLWLGRLRWAAGQEAAPVLRRAVEQAGDAPEPWVTLAAYLAATDRDDEAEDVLQEAGRRLPEELAPLALARGYEAIGQGERAEELYREVLAARPDDIPTLNGAAAFSLRNGRLQEAQSHLRRIVERHAGTADAEEARRTLALITAAGGNRREALRMLEGPEWGVEAGSDPEDLRAKAKVLALQPNRSQRRQAIALMNEVVDRQLPRADDLFLLAQLHEADGNWVEARRWMERLLETFGRAPEHLAHYTRGLLRHGDVAEAQAMLNELERLAPDQPGTIEIRARVLVASGKGDEAAALLKRFASDDPARLVPSAQLLEELGQDAVAEELYRLFADRNRAEQPGAVLPLARFLGRGGRTEEALDLLDEDVWEAMPPELVSNLSVVILYGAKSDGDQHHRVAERLVRAIREHPDAVSIQFDLANVRTLQGNYAEAAAIYRAIHERDTTVSGPLNNLAWMLAVRGEGGDEALAIIQQAIEIEGETPDLLDTRALVYMATDRADLAIRDLEEAIAVRPNAAEMYFHLARAYQLAGRPDDVAATLRKAQELGLTVDDLHPLERAAFDRLVGGLAWR